MSINIKIDTKTLTHTQFNDLILTTDIKLYIKKTPIIFKKGNIVSEKQYNDIITGNIDKTGINDLSDYSKTIVITNHKKYKDSRPTFNLFLNSRCNSKVFIYHHKMAEFQWYDTDLYRKQMKDFKKNIKTNQLEIIDYDKSHTIKGNTYYSFALTNPTLHVCIGSMEVFGYLVTGFVFYYKSETDRNNGYKYLSNK